MLFSLIECFCAQLMNTMALIILVLHLLETYQVCGEKMRSRFFVFIFMRSERSCDTLASLFAPDFFKYKIMFLCSCVFFF